MNRIGITETYDPCFVPDWEVRLLDANIVISKELTDEMIGKLVMLQDRIIFHHTVTGQGGTVLEPYVKPAAYEFAQFRKLLAAGFDISHYVLRLDPIILFNKACQDNIINVLDMWHELMVAGCTQLRCRVSMVDLYPHAVERLKAAGFPLLWDSFTAPKMAFKRAREIIGKYTDIFHFESCAEATPIGEFVEQCGCASYKDLAILGKNQADYGYPENKPRPTCQCLAKKQILGVKPGQCGHGCLYCFWK